MMNRRRIVFFSCFLLPALLVHFFSRFDPSVIERYYTHGLYQYTSLFLRFCFGWLPFSIGDWLYGFFVLWLLLQVTRFLRRCYTTGLKKNFLAAWLPAIKILLILYTAFNLLWGLNYNRAGIASQLEIETGEYTTASLFNIDSLLLLKVNESRRQIATDSLYDMHTREIFEKASQYYAGSARRFPFFENKFSSVKKSMWGWLGNYTGFTGYYNPFTGEAQVNTTVPAFLLPFTTCHEIAHQLGYAKENEANFVGYLVATQSGDVAFSYSAYLELFIYANRALYSVDSAAAKHFATRLDTAVIQDLDTWTRFVKKHKNPAEPVISWLYGKYLQGNQQPEGVQSYDRVTALLIAFYNKYGKL
jgi:hypothetical protein